MLVGPTVFNSWFWLRIWWTKRWTFGSGLVCSIKWIKASSSFFKKNKDETLIPCKKIGTMMQHVEHKERRRKITTMMFCIVYHWWSRSHLLMWKKMEQAWRWWTHKWKASTFSMSSHSVGSKRCPNFLFPIGALVCTLQHAMLEEKLSTHACILDAPSIEYSFS